MDMDLSSGQHQDTGSLENMITGTKASTQERKPRPQQEQALKCPRCDSTNTKFCYYNNYSLSQPRYFCKSCRRYWTKGGTLRNVPVGGGCRRNKRSSSSSSTNTKRSSDIDNNNQLVSACSANANPLATSISHLAYDSNDLVLAFSRIHEQNQKPNGQLGFNVESHQFSIMGTDNFASTTVLDALRSGFLENPGSNFYYNYGNGSSNSMGSENCGTGFCGSGEMNILNSEDVMSMSSNCGLSASATMKTEFVKEDENSKTLWGFPWQNINMSNGNGVISDGVLDSGREIWNYGFGSTTTNNWHGILL